MLINGVLRGGEIVSGWGPDRRKNFALATPGDIPATLSEDEF